MERRFVENKSGRALPDSQDIRSCTTCGRDFVAWDRLPTKYCSLECRSIQRRKFGEKKCTFCGKVVTRPSGKYGRYEREFCSITCEAKCVQRTAGKRKFADRQTSSRYKGVCYNKRRKKWVAMIGIDGRQVYLGGYSAEEDAARAYDAAALRYFGKFANLNLPNNAVG